MNRKFLSTIPSTHQLLLKIINPPQKRQVVNPRPQTPQGESGTKPGKLLLIILSLVCKSDIKEVHGELSNPLFKIISLHFIKYWSTYVDVLHSCQSLRKKVKPNNMRSRSNHDDVIKWKHFPRYWLFVRGIHRPLVISPHKGQWRGALMFSLICVWINGWVNNREADDLKRHRAHHYDVILMRI